MLKPIRFLPPQATQILDLASQLKTYETASLSDIEAVQQLQLAGLLKHAWTFSPFWRDRLQQAGFNQTRPDAACLSNLPVLTRQEVQTHFNELRAHWPELDTKQLITASSSGSTGTPVRVEKDARTYLPLYGALSWVEGLWHQRDARLTIAVLGTGLKPTTNNSWGNLYSALGLQGRSEVRAAESGSLDEHLDWLVQLKPAYLKCSPVLAAELAQRAMERGISLPLRHLISQWERISPRHQALCEQAFSARIVDRYSCEELGWLALACGSHQQLHVTSASVFLEIVDEHNRPCPVGVPGRVLVTALQGYVMPLIRYEIGDLAQWGSPCACGMSMPVIDKLWGRIRHQITLPDGKRIPMPFLGDELGRLPAINAFRILQHPAGELSLLVESAGALSSEDKNLVRQIFARNGLSSVPLKIKDQQQIDWGNRRKREEFIRTEQAFDS